MNFIKECLYSWSDEIIAATFEDDLARVPGTIRDHIIRYLKGNMDLVVKIAEREHGVIDHSMKGGGFSSGQDAPKEQLEALIGVLDIIYEGPGSLHPNGPRHDNDFIDISDIAIAPTEQELRCTIPPYLPANIPKAPHPHPPESIERCLDIQFRLLREELM